MQQLLFDLNVLVLKISFLTIPAIYTIGCYTNIDFIFHITHVHTHAHAHRGITVILSLQVIEKQCLQDLMYCAVHAPRKGSRSMFHSLRCVLACFHRHISQQNVITMLVRLYGPFLWRSLNVCVCVCLSVYVFVCVQGWGTTLVILAMVLTKFEDE